jgi:hypothetical protein
MGNLIQSMPGHNYSRFDDKAFEHDGCIVDLGCVHWDWSNTFVGKKRVIGADPFETTIPDGFDLFQGVVGPFNGFISMIYDKDASAISTNDVNDSELVPMYSWKTFCKKFNIDNISILKMNIEGSEYPLLNSMDTDDFAKIDQIIVSFHDWLVPEWNQLTIASTHLLEQHGFTVKNIGPYNWCIALRQ